ARPWQHVDYKTWASENATRLPKMTSQPAVAAAAVAALAVMPPPVSGLPRARQERVLTTDMGDEIVLYDRREHRGHCLNRSAAAVWRRLDGRSSMEEIVAHLRQEVDPAADEETVWLALEELEKAGLLEGSVERPVSEGTSRRSLLRGMGAAAVLLPVISTVIAPPAYAQVSGVACSPADTCATFTCANGCACVPTTEGNTVCIVPTCVSACTTTADCPPGTVCFTLGCCGPATFCVPLAPAGTDCQV
ncbi:MAG TPA: PqqD family protein, partial [Thermoanaerobaculia bacterium]|nr:PqqD family protein [Thermoanaerobaculia bacterium]